jgi:outer membrane protein assembly factor BamA
VVDFSMHDLFENHHINGGLTLFLSDLELRNNASYLEYQFLQNRIDLKFRADRRAVQNSALNQLFRQRDVLSQVGFSASFPLSNALRVELNPFMQQAKRAIFDIRNIGLGGEDRLQYYWGAAGNLVFDNSTRTGLNQMAGTRLMLRSSYQISPGAAERNFGEISADLRTYLPVHREITLACRASGGSFFGNSPKKYLLGGVDNWMFRDYHISRQKDDPLLGYRDDVLSLKSDETQSDWLFNRFCTNLRGYRINAAYGTGFMLLNAELRIPLVRYIYKGPINSNFWRNFQVMVFGDMGSAWTGAGPWKKSNSLNTRTVNEGNFSVRVKSYENPYLSSYGFGIRTMVLGYFSRMDVVWPLQKDADRVSGSNPMDYRNSASLMLSIGHDF